MIKTLVLFSTAACMALPSAAEKLQFQCGGLEGQSFYAEEGFVPKGKGGWSKDRTGDGESVITLDTSDIENLKVSYSYKDATGAWYNAETEGGSIISMGMDYEDLSFMFLVVYPQTSSVELITITEISGLGGRMIYSTMKNTSSFMNAKLMTAECRFPKSFSGN